MTSRGLASCRCCAAASALCSLQDAKQNAGGVAQCRLLITARLGLQEVIRGMVMQLPCC